ncbi:MAG TPA: 50S ribosomal protein L9 [Phycisphaerales bacterium]|nr:50S ribosomal protein L9 [Phycisphaerales bacterium]
MAKNVELLLTENVDNLGIVGDVVKVRTGYARNYLLPRSLATEPSDELIGQLAAKRAEAQRLIAEQRRSREQMIQKMDGMELVTVHSCNDLGILYAAVTQNEIAEALGAKGMGVRPRDVRLGQTIKRVGTYDVLIKPESDLEAHIKLVVQPDRELDLDDDRGREAEAAAPEAAPAGAASADTAAAGAPGAPAPSAGDEKAHREAREQGGKAGQPARAGGASSASGGKAAKPKPSK